MKEEKILGNETQDAEGAATVQGQAKVSELDRMFVRFVRLILQRFEHPEGWPLRDDERVSLIKEIYYEARQLEQRVDFNLLHLRMALDQSPRVSNTSGCVEKKERKL